MLYTIDVVKELQKQNTRRKKRMKKERGLYVMNTQKGALLKTAEFDKELTFRCNFDQCIINGQPIAAVDDDNEFSDHHKEFATKLAEFLSQDGELKVPVVVEFDIKVTGLDGTEYDIEEIQANDDNNESELAKLLGMLARNSIK